MDDLAASLLVVDDPLPSQAPPPAPGGAVAGRGCPDRGGHARLGRNLGLLVGSQALTWILSIAWTAIVPRLLGPREMGVLVTAGSVAGIFGILLGEGTKTFLVREIVARPDGAPGLVGTAISLRLLMLPVFFGAAMAYSHFAEYGGNTTLVLACAMGAVFVVLLAEPIQAAFQAQERMQYLAYNSVLDEVAQCILGIGIAVLGFGALGLTAGSLAVAVLMLVLNLKWARTQVAVELRLNLERARTVIRGSASYWAYGLFFMFYLWIDTMILSLLAGPETVAWYGVPTKLFTALMFIPVIVSTAWLPRLVAAFERRPEDLPREARRPIELVVILSLPICVATALTAGPVLDLLYGHRYASAAPVMTILAFVIPPMYLNIMLNQVLIAAKRQVVWTWVMAGATVVNPLLNVLIIPICQRRYGNGAIGAALSLLITELLIVAIGMRISGSNLFGTASLLRVAKAFAASGAMWAVMAVAAPLGFVPAAALGFAGFIGLSLLLKLPTADELGAVQTAARRFAQRFGRSPVPATPGDAMNPSVGTDG